MKYIAYTDGSCDNLNPKRPGGSAYIIFNEDGTEYKRASKGFMGTTNNRMELLAIISVVNSVPEGSEVEINTDSQYCILACKSKKPKKNIDLVNMYKRIASRHRSIRFNWVKGHNGNRWNEECDRMANGEYQLMR
jgi:ribonuclease HI